MLRPTFLKAFIVVSLVKSLNIDLVNVAASSTDLVLIVNKASSLLAVSKVWLLEAAAPA